MRSDEYSSPSKHANRTVGSVAPGGIPAGAPEWVEADPIFEVSKTASMTECTGLMPTMAQTDAEGEALSKIEAIHSIKGAHSKN